MIENLKFDAPKNSQSIIKVIGVGGGGGNAVNYMFRQGIQGVDFVICNTDAKALINSPIPAKIQLGASGLGAGNIAEIGRQAALESIDDIKEVLGTNTEMLFVTACLGGGTGTGGAPVVAALAKEMGILTVAIVTIPFSFEGRKRVLQAQEGINELRQNVDSLLVICNDRIRELHRDLTLSDAFGMADNVLSTAAKGIAEIITVDGYVNIDFNDVKTVMSNSGVAIMGAGMAEGPGRAIEAAKEAIASPLLNDNDIRGASNILLYIGAGKEELLMSEVEDILEYVQSEAGSNADIIWGNCNDESLGNKLSITLVATGFVARETITPTTIFETPKKIVYDLNSGAKKEEEKPPTEAQKKEEPKKEEQQKEETVSYNFTPEMTTAEPVNEPFNEPEQQFMAEEKEVVKDQVKEAPIVYNLYSDEPAEEHTEVTADEMYVFQKKAEVKKEEQTAPVFDKMMLNNEVEETVSGTRSAERIAKLRELSHKVKTPEGLEELEKVPAYVRQKIELKEPEPSSETQTSRYTLYGDENKTELRNNNPYLHDKPD